MTNHGRALGLTLLLGALGLFSGCGNLTTAPLPSPTRTLIEPAPAPTQNLSTTPPNTSATPDVAATLELLAAIPEKGRAAKTGYSRDNFGNRWQDVDNNGCDTRNDILRRDLTDVKAEDGTRGCVITSGVLVDPYSGKKISFTKGEQTSALVQIDHVVALSNAWQTGAQQLSPAERAAFANDPLNLLAVDGELNSQKSDADAATWLPPRTEYRQAYVTRQVQVKAKYRLWMTSAEKQAITRVLSGQSALVPDQAPARAKEPAPTPSKTQPSKSSANQGTANKAPVAAPQPTKPTQSDAYYKNCDAARAAGAAPIHVGEPGYRKGLDGDNDGIACEPK